MGTLPPADVWGNGMAYERYMGRWSRLVAGVFLDWLAAPPAGRWLDVGCGTGVLTRAILEQAAPIAVRGSDAAPGYIAYATQRIPDRRAHFSVSDAVPLLAPSDRYDAVVAGLMLNFVPDPAQALAEMARVARPGGLVAAYVWDYAGQMEMLRAFWDAAVALDPAARDLDEGQRFPLCQPEPLGQLWRGGGLAGVAVRAIDVPTIFRSVDDFWTPFLGGQGPAPGYVASLGEEQRTALREGVQARLPRAADGSIVLSARAWAVRGVRPALPVG